LRPETESLSAVRRTARDRTMEGLRLRSG
jgi:hypothetical protein